MASYSSPIYTVPVTVSSQHVRSGKTECGKEGPKLLLLVRRQERLQSFEKLRPRDCEHVIRPGDDHHV